MITNPPSITRDLSRIISLERRQPTPEHLAAMTSVMHGVLQYPGASMSLRPVQAQALWEMYTWPERGLYGLIPVGGGKTLPSLLAPICYRSQRAVLILPAGLRRKTEKDLAEISKSFRVSMNLQIIHYEALRRVAGKDLLEQIQPDLIICDEAQALRNTDIGCTKRIKRYLRAHMQTRFVALSGSTMRESILEFAHLLAWTHGPAECPLPLEWMELKSWDEAIKGNTDRGALSYLAGEGNLQQAVGRRISDTRGVIFTDTQECRAHLNISVLSHDCPEHIGKHLQHLRTAYELPDGHEFETALEMYRHLYELALGFFCRWDPLPPQQWLVKRKAWSLNCRHILQTNHRDLDTPLQVVNAIDAGLYPEARTALAEWREIRGTFEPQTKPFWLDDFAVHLVRRIASNGRPAILWCERVVFAEALAKATGLRYYGAEGKDHKGNLVDDAKGDESIIVSRQANYRGRNLQMYSRNVIITPSGAADIVEQKLGRTHRAGQLAPVVDCEVLVTCAEHLEALNHARHWAKYIENLTGQPQKLNLARYL